MPIHVTIEKVGPKKQDRLFVGDAASHMQQLVDLFRVLDRDDDNPKQINFELVQISKNSPMALTVHAVNVDNERARHLVTSEKRMARRLRELFARPSSHEFNEEEILYMDRLCAISKSLKREGRQIRVTLAGHHFEIGESTLSRFEVILNKTFIEYGSISGRMEILRNRKDPGCTLYPLAGPTSVFCEFQSKDLLSQAMTHFLDNDLVDVYGKLHTRLRSKYPHKIVVERFERVETETDYKITEFFNCLEGVEVPEGGWRDGWE